MAYTITDKWGIAFYERQGLTGVYTSNETPLSGFPLSNLANRRLHSVCRLPVGTAVEFTMDMSTGPGPGTGEFDIIALIGVNFSINATWRVQVSSTGTFSGGALKFDTNPGGAGTWPFIFDQSLLAANNFQQYAPPFGRNAIFAFTGYATGTLPAGAYFRFTVNDPYNVDGYLQAAIGEAGSLWSPSLRNFETDWTRGADPVASAGSGSDGFPLHKVLRWHEFTQKRFTDQEDSDLRNHFMSYGPHGRVLLLPRPLAPETWPNDAIWCVMKDQPEFSAAEGLSWAGRYQAKRFKFMEVDE